MKINEVIENLEETPRPAHTASLVTTPKIVAQGHKKNSKVNSKPDNNDQSWVDVTRAWVDRVKHAPRAKPQTSIVQGAKNAFSWPDDPKRRSHK